MVQAERKLLPAATRVFALRLQQGFRGDALLAPLDPQDLQSVQLPELLRGNPYPGRGIALAHGPAGETLAAYFIMGRSANSRNRVFRFDGQDLFSEPHDPKQVEDPSLIIYRALSHPTIGHETATLVTNGDQTDTILNALKKQQSFTEALQTRRFEPDAPNFTPRISGLLFADRIEMAILKAQDSEGKHNSFHSYRYEAEPGIGRFLSTYQTDGNPLPSFAGEPLRFLWDGDAQTFAERLWRALDPQNRIALFIEATDSAGTAHFQFSRFEEKL